MTETIENLGDHLRHAREQSGVTLRQIADATNLSVRSLTALENNKVEQLPGGIYRRAIVRHYASHVGLDPESTLRAFLARYPDDVPTWSQLLPARQPSPGARALRTLLGLMNVL